MDSTDALALARRFNGAISQAQRGFYEPLQLSTGQRLVRFVNPREAVVENLHPASRSRKYELAESTFPEETNRSGKEELVNLRLVRSGGMSVPANPLVPVSFNSSTLMFGALDVSVRIAGAKSSPLWNLGDEAFGPSALPDADVVDAATATGAEQWLQLRSAAAPHVINLDFSLPHGARLIQKPDGSLVVAVGARNLLRVLAPTANDALGHPVSASFSVVGNSALLRVRAPETATYPLTVDPLYVGGNCAPAVSHAQDPFDYIGADCLNQAAGPENTGSGGAQDTFSQWTYAGGGTAFGYTTTNATSLPSGYKGNGLFVFTQNAAYSTGSYGEYYYLAPPGAFIQEVDFYRAEHQLSAAGASSLYEGIYSESKQAWEPMTAYDTDGFTTSSVPSGKPFYITGQRAYYQQDIYVGNSQIPSQSTAQGTLGNAAVFGLSTPKGGQSHLCG